MVKTKWFLIHFALGILFIGVIAGISLVVQKDNMLMGDYDLYNCIYNNAESNDFPQHPTMIKTIQDECICFREHNYTNLLEVNCSR